MKSNTSKLSDFLHFSEKKNGVDLSYFISNLSIQSRAGRRILNESLYLIDKKSIQHELDLIEKTIGLIGKYDDSIKNIQNKLAQLKDIHRTIERIKRKEVPDDIELFEIKSFSLISCDIALVLKTINTNIVSIPDLEAVVRLLDPDDKKIPHFYIYDSYSADLKTIRKKIKALSINDEKRAQLYVESLLLEDKIREDLAEKLSTHSKAIENAFLALVKLDILIAKAQQAIDWELCKPMISEKTAFKALFNPEIKKLLQKEGKNFQPIDIELHRKTNLITGANMGGKTLLLKTIGLAQILFQFGFYIPACKAQMNIVDKILISIGDEQNEQKGLSSFAAEMMQIDSIIKEIKKGGNLLILIDEPARTTNPDEGKAIVNAIVEYISAHQTRALVTTHYNGIRAESRKLRVKGFIKNKNKENIDINNINRFMDYSLVEDRDEKVPREALNIASILGVEKELIENAKKYLGN